jgi:pyruvate/2-oxoglutarate dehydrogenase complex dihydrolipoamide dehydrogenase (E3) component
MIEPHLNLEPDDDSNRELAANVHPPDWRNPTPAGRYNLVVLGAGTAGLVAAAGAAGLGARVALVERHLMGGDCLNVGCVPSKAMIRSAHTAHAVRTAPTFGVRVTGETMIDFARAMERMRSLRAGISSHDSARRFRDHHGVDVYFGDARFTGPDTVSVDGTTLRFRRGVIATGARAAVPLVDGLDEVGFLTNHDVFNLTEQPHRLAVIGCGPIGCELAQVFARLGTEVTMIEASQALLPREDADASTLLEASMRRDGVEVLLSTTVGRVERTGDATVLYLNAPSGEVALTVDRILVSAGRRPNVEGLDLETAGIAFDRTGVKVNDLLQTSNRRVYASGDVCLPFKFTHTADAVSRAVIQNALFPWPKKRLSSLIVPWCTYTDPEIAHVGLYPPQAEARGIPVDTWEVAMADVDRAITDGETEGFLKVYCKRGKDAIVGATLVGVRAGDVISEVTTAMVAGFGLGSFSSVIHPYPTRAEIIRKAGDAYNRTRLTPTVASVMQKWFRFTRRL